MSESTRREWLDYLNGDDLGFVKRFVLSSGSLKEMAKQYGVSYPTVRRRLDRVIAKITAIDDTIEQTEFERLLSVLSADGRIDAAIQRMLLEVYRKEQES